MKQRISLILGFLSSLFFLWLGFRGLAFGEIWDALTDINPIWVLISFPVYFLAIYVLTWRWWYLFRPIKNVHPNRLYPVVLIGYMANNLLPFRLGEILRAYVLKKRENVNIAPTLSTIFIERVFDGMTMLAFIFTALFFIDFDEPALQTVIYLTTPLFFGALVMFFVLAANPETATRVYTWLINKFAPGALRPKLLEIVGELMSGLSALRSGRALFLTVLTSFLSWTLESSTYFIVMQAFDFEVNFFVLLLVVGFGNLSTILPSTAGYVGTFHAVAILTLTTFGVDRLQAGSYAIVMHATLWLPMTISGFIYLVKFGFGWRDIKAAQDVADEQLPDQFMESEAAV